MLSNTNELIDKLNVAKTLYSKYDKNAEKHLSKHLLTQAFRDVYQQANSVMIGFVLLHLILAFIFAYLYPESWTTMLIVGGITTATFYLSVIFYPYTFFTRAFAGIALQSFVLLYLYQTNGQGELRFIFFLAFTILIVYQDWRAFLPSAFLFLGQLMLMVYLSNIFDSLIIFNESYKELLSNLIPQTPEGDIDFQGLWFYIAISVVQLILSSLWAGLLRLQTIKEVHDKQALLQEQSKVSEANEELEANVQKKTEDLQEALNTAQANEEELRQNMEELQATQDEIESQRKQLLINNERMGKVEKELRERQSEMERQQWLESNLSRFDDVMRLNYDKPLEEFTDKIMLNLAEIIDITQGAFYVYDEVEDAIKMRGGYACTPNSVKQAVFKTGEGMLGQILKTKKKVQIENLPDDGAVIESALTTLRNKTLVIIPLLYNEDVQGVIELAMLRQIDEVHLEFLERLAKNIAAMLQSIRGILRTQRLLQQSQDMTSQLQENARELERTKQEVEQKAAEFQAQFKAIDRSMLVLEFTLDGYIISTNYNFSKLSGYSQEELKDKHQSIFLHERVVNAASYQNQWEKIRTGEYVEAEYECVDKQNETFWIRANYYSLGEGNKRRVMILAYDTTKEKAQDQKILEQLHLLKDKEEIMRKNLEVMRQLKHELEQKARDYQDQLSAINVSTAMIEYDPEGNIIYINDKFAEISGYNSQELIGKPQKEILQKRFAGSKAFRRLWETLRRNEFVEGEFEIVAKDQSLIWLRGSYYPVVDERHHLVKVMLLAANITNEKQQEEQIKDYLLNLEKTQTTLQEKTTELSAQLDAIDQSAGMIEMTPDGKITRANEKFSEYVGYEINEMVGNHHRMLLPIDQRKDTAYLEFWEKLNQNKFMEGEFVRQNKNGRSFCLRASYFPVKNNQDQVVKIIGIISDMSKIKNEVQQVAKK